MHFIACLRKEMEAIGQPRKGRGPENNMKLSLTHK